MTSEHLPPAPPLYRLHVKTSSYDREGSLRFCLDGGFLGVGWGMGPGPMDWAAYGEAASRRSGGVDQSVRALHDLSDGALIWTRDTTGVYYLGRVEGPWRYLSDERADRFDIHNVRPARIVSCGVEAVVPGKVANAFIPRRTLQRVKDGAARRYSASLFAELNGQPAPWRPTFEQVLTSCLTSQDLEDLVAVYLQRRHGYLVLPGTRRPDTPAYEFVLRHPDGHLAVVQVKAGRSPVPRDAASLPTASVDRVYVASPTGTYSGEPAANVHELSPEELIAFMRAEPACLPPAVEHWVSRASDE